MVYIRADQGFHLKCKSMGYAVSMDLQHTAHFMCLKSDVMFS